MSKKKIIMITVVSLIVLGMISFFVIGKTSEPVKSPAVEIIEDIDTENKNRIWEMIQLLDLSIEREDIQWEWCTVTKVPYDLDSSNIAQDLEVVQFYRVDKNNSGYPNYPSYDLYTVLWNHKTNKVFKPSITKGYREENSPVNFESGEIIFNAPYALSDKVKMSFYFESYIRVGGNNSEGIMENELLLYRVANTSLHSIGKLVLSSTEHRSYGHECENFYTTREGEKSIQFIKNNKSSYNDIVVKQKIGTYDTSPPMLDPKVVNKYELLELSYYVVKRELAEEEFHGDCEETVTIEDKIHSFYFDSKNGEYVVYNETFSSTEIEPYEQTANALLRKEGKTYNVTSESSNLILNFKGKNVELLLKVENTEENSKEGYLLLIDSRTQELIKLTRVTHAFDISQHRYIDRIVFNLLKTWRVSNKTIYEYRTFYIKEGEVSVSTSLFYLDQHGEAIMLLKNHKIGGLTKLGEDNYIYCYDVTLTKITENSTGSLTAEYTYNQATLTSTSDITDREKFKNMQIGLKEYVPLSTITTE